MVDVVETHVSPRDIVRTASPHVHAESRQFLTERSHPPQAGLNTFIDGFGFAALAATPRRYP